MTLMTGLRILVARVRGLAGRRRADRDLRQELASHVDEAAEELVRQGLPPADARRAALQRFGGISQTEEASRDVRALAWFEAAGRDVRHACRSLRRNPGFALVAIGTLALGMGAVTTLFTVLDGVLVRPLPYPRSDTLVAVFSTGLDPRKLLPRVTGGDEIDLVAEPGLFLASAYYFGGEVGAQAGASADFAGVQFVHPDFFRVLDVPPLAGRLFSRGDVDRSAIVTTGFALRRFGGSTAALHQPVFVESRTYEIVGVMPDRMAFPAKTDVWIAAPLLPQNRNRSGYNYRVVGRLAPDESIGAANTKLSALSARLAQAFPESNRQKTFAAIPLRDSLVGDVRSTLYVLMAAAGLLLLIACANVANLMLARGTTRAREVAVRGALGASRAQIIRQFLIESLVLATTACVLGTGLAYAGTAALIRFSARDALLPRLQEIHVDWRVLIFCVLLACATTIVCGLAPGWQASRARVGAAFGVWRARGTIGSRGRARGTLVVVQLALSCLLATDASLLMRSLASLNGAPLGFRPSGVLVMYAHAPAKGSIFDQSGLDAYLRVGRRFDEVLTQVRRAPHVVAAGSVMGLPTGQYGSDGTYAVDGVHPYSAGRHAGFRLASAGYFGTMGMPIARGRDFDVDDTYERMPVAIVSQALARQSFGDRDPLGARIMCGLDRPDTWMTIVGVVGDVRQESPAATPGPELYMPVRQHPYMANDLQIVARADGSPDAIADEVRALVTQPCRMRRRRRRRSKRRLTTRSRDRVCGRRWSRCSPPSPVWSRSPESTRC